MIDIFIVTRCHKDLLFRSPILLSSMSAFRLVWKCQTQSCDISMRHCFCLHAFKSACNIKMTGVLFSCSSEHFVVCWFAVLDVYVLSTDGQVQDFHFPQSNEDGISIHLSANTVKLNSRNGEPHFKVLKAENRNFLKPGLLHFERPGAYLMS